MSSIFDRFSRVWQDGERGFGKESYNAAKASGISDRELNQSLQGFRIGKLAQENINRGMNSNDIYSRFATIWGDGRLGIGREGYETARAAGITDEQLLQAGGGGRIGKVAMQRINQGVQAAAETRAKENEFAKMQENFANQMTAYQNQMETQRQQYQDSLAQMTNTLNATMQPQTRQNVLGVAGAGGGKVDKGRRGVKGTFARSGLRIKNINV